MALFGLLTSKEELQRNTEVMSYYAQKLVEEGIPQDFYFKSAQLVLDTWKRRYKATRDPQFTEWVDRQIPAVIDAYNKLNK